MRLFRAVSPCASVSRRRLSRLRIAGRIYWSACMWQRTPSFRHEVGGLKSYHALASRFRESSWAAISLEQMISRWVSTRFFACTSSTLVGTSQAETAHGQEASEASQRPPALPFRCSEAP